MKYTCTTVQAIWSLWFFLLIFNVTICTIQYLKIYLKINLYGLKYCLKIKYKSRISRREIIVCKQINSTILTIFLFVVKISTHQSSIKFKLPFISVKFYHLFSHNHFIFRYIPKLIGSNIYSTFIFGGKITW